MFSFDDFNKDSEFYENLIPEQEDLAEFASSLMLVTHMLKSINYDDSLRSGHELMMKIFNMSGLEPEEDNEQPLNVIMCLLTHTFALLSHSSKRDEYFKYFDNTVIYPLIEEGKNGLG